MTLVLGILIGASIAVMIVALLCFWIESYQYRKHRKPRKRYLCPTCETGMKLHQLDNSDGMCPYLNWHTGDYCAYYQPMPKKKMERGSLNK
ncbi:MAG: hypothetical protein J6A56_03195 [Clostridia bacterium]|nr:hypothetical protein [Clostridia bacterium]